MDPEDTIILHGSSGVEHQNLIPPGIYKVEIELHALCVQSPYPMTSDFQLRLSYKPFLFNSSLVWTIDKKSFRELPNCDRPRMMAGIQNGPLQLIAKVGPGSVEALKEPIMIESSHGVAEINFIDVFSAPILKNKRKLRNGADLISKSDGTTIGFLIYSIRVQETSTIGESSGVEQSEFGPKPSSLSKTPNDPPPPTPLPGSPQQGIDLTDEQTGIASSEEDESSSEEEDEISSEEEDKSSSEEEDKSSSEEEDESSSEDEDEGPPPSKRCKSLANEMKNINKYRKLLKDPNAEQSKLEKYKLKLNDEKFAHNLKLKQMDDFLKVALYSSKLRNQSLIDLKNLVSDQLQIDQLEKDDYLAMKLKRENYKLKEQNDKLRLKNYELKLELKEPRAGLSINMDSFSEVEVQSKLARDTLKDICTTFLNHRQL